MKTENNTGNEKLDYPIKYTIPILIADEEKKRPIQVGTGVLAKYRSHHLILTAGHCIEDAEASLLIPYKNVMIGFGGPVTYFSEKECEFPNGKDDLFDIGIIRIDQNLDKILEQFEFLDLTDHQRRNKSRIKSFLCLGLPCSRSKLNPKSHSVKSEIMSYFGLPCTEEQKRKHGVKPYNICVGYDRNQTINIKTGEKVVGYQAKGMSGSGIWVQTDAPDRPFELSGIAIEHDEENGSFIGTNIDAIMGNIEIALNDA